MIWTFDIISKLLRPVQSTVSNYLQTTNASGNYKYPTPPAFLDKPASPIDVPPFDVRTLLNASTHIFTDVHPTFENDKQTSRSFYLLHASLLEILTAVTDFEISLPPSYPIDCLPRQPTQPMTWCCFAKSIAEDRFCLIFLLHPDAYQAHLSQEVSDAASDSHSPDGTPQLLVSYCQVLKSDLFSFTPSSSVRIQETLVAIRRDRPIPTVMGNNFQRRIAAEVHTMRRLISLRYAIAFSQVGATVIRQGESLSRDCLLYTSDAADD